MTSVPTIAANAVDVKTALVSMPCEARLEKMLGLTARMYAIVRNVVMPAIISVLRLFLAGSNPKSFKNITYYIVLKGFAVIIMSVD